MLFNSKCIFIHLLELHGVYLYAFQSKNNISFFYAHKIIVNKLFNSKFWIGNAVFQSNCIQFNLIESNWIQLNPIKSEKSIRYLKYAFGEKKISMHFNPFSFAGESHSSDTDSFSVVSISSKFLTIGTYRIYIACAYRMCV